MNGRKHIGVRPGRAKLQLIGVAISALMTAACSGGGPTLTPPSGPQAKEIPAPIPKAASELGALTLGTAGTTPVPTNEDGSARAKVKIGLLLPLSGAGQTALIAQSMQRAAELALSDMKALNVELIVRDDKGTPEGALAAATEVAAAGAEIVLGPLFSKSVAAASSVTRAKAVPMIAFSNDRGVAGQGVHLLSFLAGPEVQRVVSYAYAQGKKRFAGFIPDDAYGRAVEAEFRQTVARLGGSVVALKTYSAADVGGRTAPMLEQLKALKSEMRAIEEHGDPIDAILIPGGEELNIGPLFKQVDIDPAKIKVLGTGALDTPNAGRDAALVGAWYASPDPRGFKEFGAKYGRAHGLAPPRIASLAYDATAVAAAFANGPQGARYIPSSLTRLAGFNGVDGLFRFSAEGPAERSLAVLEVREMGAQVIDQAPPTLGAGGGVN